MSAYITIDSVKAFWTSSGLKLYSLVQNTDTTGMCKFESVSKDTENSTVEIPVASKQQCVKRTLNDYISTMYELIYLEGSSTFKDYARLYTSYCSSGENSTCTACGTYGGLNHLDVSVNNYIYDITPNSVTNLALTPGNGTLYANWTSPTNTSIYAYLIDLKQGTTSLVRGYVKSPGFTISNLTNGTSYTLEVQAVSEDFIFSTTKSKSEIPTEGTNMTSYTINGEKGMRGTIETTTDGILLWHITAPPAAVGDYYYGTNSIHTPGTYVDGAGRDQLAVISSDMVILDVADSTGKPSGGNGEVYYKKTDVTITTPNGSTYTSRILVNSTKKDNTLLYSGLVAIGMGFLYMITKKKINTV